jgi:hypothetical protein
MVQFRLFFPEALHMDVKPNHGTNASVHLDAIRGAAALTVFLRHGRPLFLRSGLSSMLKTGTHADAPQETSAADDGA